MCDLDYNERIESKIQQLNSLQYIVVLKCIHESNWVEYIQLDEWKKGEQTTHVNF